MLSGDGSYTGSLTSDISVSLAGSTAFDGKITYNANSYGWNHLYNLDITNADATGASTDLELNSRLNAQSSAANQTVGNLTGSSTGSIWPGAPNRIGGGITINQTVDGTYAGSIGFNGHGVYDRTFSVLKQGSANLTLSHPTGLTFDGALQVNEGTLTLNGNWAQAEGTTNDQAQCSDLQVQSGATLAGTGSAALAGDHSIAVATGGTVAPGDRLPTRQELEQTYCVGWTTVQRAMDELHKDGFIVSRGRNGTFVVDIPPHLNRYALVFATHPSAYHAWSLRYDALIQAAQRLEVKCGISIETYYGVNGSDASTDFQRLLQDAAADDMVWNALDEMRMRDDWEAVAFEIAEQCYWNRRRNAGEKPGGVERVYIITAQKPSAHAPARRSCAIANWIRWPWS